MRLLFLTPQLPYPPRQGTALRNWGLIRHLAARRHEVWLLTFDEAPHTPLPALLGETCARVVRIPAPRRTHRQRLRNLLTSALPDIAWRLWSPAFLSTLRDLLSGHHFDVVQVEGIELARYGMALTREAGRLPARLVFDDHNCEYLLQQRTFQVDMRSPLRWHAALYSLVQWQRLRVFERRAARVASLTLCVSEQDAQALRRLDAQLDPQVIPNGIDVAEYASATPSQSSGAPTLVFTGKMDFRPNVNAMLWFSRAVWPTVKAAHPQARLLIVGQKPSARLDGLRNDPSICLTGEVEDVRPYIAQADVYVAPLLAGGGTRFKLLEAMSMRKAIVTTTLGCEGFEVASGREMIIADSAAEFAGAVNELLRSPARRKELGERAYRFVSARYDWTRIVPSLEALYQDLLRPKR